MLPRAAETIAPSVARTLDAIHLATAVRLIGAGQLDALMTYDKQLADGAREHAISVLAPVDTHMSLRLGLLASTT